MKTLCLSVIACLFAGCVFAVVGCGSVATIGAQVDPQGTPCAVTDDCPDGYDCVEVRNADDPTTKKVCMPTLGQ